MTNETNVKICYECNIEKPLNKFHYKYQKSKLKYNFQCKDCANHYLHEYSIRQFHVKPPKIIQDGMKHCTRCETTKPWNQFHYRTRNNKMCYMYRCIICDNEVGRIERKILLSDPLRKKKFRKNKQEMDKMRKSIDPAFNLKTKLRGRLSQCIKSGKEWSSHLGCSIEFLQEWFEYQFRLLKVFDSIELSWKNRKEWHIDHVIPCNAFDFTDESQRKICFHWSNLAPYPVKDNCSKCDKIIPQLIRRQIILANIYKNITGNNDKTVAIATICDSTGALTTAANGKLLVQQVE